MLGAIEAGGTKFVCAVSDNELNIKEKITVPTTTPNETFKAVFKLFDKYKLEAIGIGSFGPIDINKKSDTYGYITSTPKTFWKNTNFLGIFKERYQVPIGWNTDVNAAALGESKFGAAKDKKCSVYITIGTGIGGGVIINEKPLTGYNHPEMGHFYVPKHPDDNFEGVCKYHKNCLEGMAAGPAIEKRFRMNAKKLPIEHKAWEFEAHYLAHAILSYTMVLSPDCIILGGGVMQQKHLFNKIHEKFEQLLNNYLQLPPLTEYIIPTKLGNNSGIIGSLCLAKEAMK